MQMSAEAEAEAEAEADARKVLTCPRASLAEPDEPAWLRSCRGERATRTRSRHRSRIRDDDNPD